MEQLKYKLLSAFQAAIAGGKQILEIYNTDFEVEYKEDESPLTIADTRCNDTILAELESRFPAVPVLSEEGSSLPYEERKGWKEFWLIDPLDGTKEFIKRNGEFTVNIALVEDGHPLLGVVYVPVKDIAYIGLTGEGAYKVENASAVGPSNYNELIKNGKKMPMLRTDKTLTVVASRSHLNDETKQYIESLEEKYGTANRVSSGSSVKLCLVAEGIADVYPRFAPTMEWDTGAGDAVCRAAGCWVVDKEGKKPLRYNKEDLHNPYFLVERL